MPQLDDKVDLAGSGDGTSVCVAGGGGSQILAVHSLVDVPWVLLPLDRVEGIHAGYCRWLTIRFKFRPHSCTCRHACHIQCLCSYNVVLSLSLTHTHSLSLSLSLSLFLSSLASGELIDRHGMAPCAD